MIENGWNYKGKEEEEIDIEKEYQGWSDKKLNDKIMALYDQIERVTIENLQIAQKNNDLEVQIHTIGDIINTHPKGKGMGRGSTGIEESSYTLKEDYGALLNSHRELEERVLKIQEAIMWERKEVGLQSVKSVNTLLKVSSISDLNKHRRDTIQKGKNYKKNGIGFELTRRENQMTSRKGKF